MRRVLKGAGYVAGALAVLMVVGSATAFTVSNRKLTTRYDVTLTSVIVPDDEEAVAWGRHLVLAVTGCRDCHGPDLSGTIMSDDAVALMAAPNLTSGQGGIGGSMADDDWVRAIRHGVRRDGSSLLIMPSYAYANLSDRDLGSMIAYLKQLPPVDNELPAMKLRPMGRALVAAGLFDEEIVARKTPFRASYDEVEPGMTFEYGRYLAAISGCTGCHRPDLKGGPSGAPDAPPAADISPAALADWDRDDFFRVIREGRRPDGTELSEYMPWRYMSDMTDDELDAIWLYLQSVETD
ncbi:MAG TPA: c-type cytochrome [Longimicrobiales bacterium]|nr:c-type cytochrome [Longimicrobiales bacterium]